MVRARKEDQNQAIGYDVAGWATKSVAMVDAPGNLVRFNLIVGQHCKNRIIKRGYDKYIYAKRHLI